MKRKCEFCGKEFIGKKLSHPYRFCSILCRNKANTQYLPQGETFWDHVEKTDYCWEWLGSRRKRYGYYRGQPAHRYSYELVHGPVPVGLELDHICRNRYCVNPDHLQAVTHQINVQRGGLAEANRRRSSKYKEKKNAK